MSAFVEGILAIAQDKIFLEIAIPLLIAQFIKLITKSRMHKRFYWPAVFENGGMPSAHTTLVTGLSIAIGLNLGFTDPLFFATAVFALIVMRDAMGARRNIDTLMEMLNKLVRLEHVHMKEAKMSSGHTPTQVLAGFLLGLITVLVLHFAIL